MAKAFPKSIRYANHVVSRSDLDKALERDTIYQRAVKRVVEAKTKQREVEQARGEITHANTLALPEEREASRLERAVVHTRRRLKELIAERDKQRSVAHSSRIISNQKMRREVSANNVLIRKYQGVFREAFDLANTRKSVVYNKLYSENYKEVLEKSGVLSKNEEDAGEFDDESLGLIPEPEEEEGKNG